MPQPNKTRVVILTTIPVACGLWLAVIWRAPRPDGPSVHAATIRERPLDIAGAGGLDGIVGRRQLATTLGRLLPRWRVAKPNHMLHALRFWGPDADFVEDPHNPYPTGTPSGCKLLALLLDCVQAEKAGVRPHGFLYSTSMGVGVQYNSEGGGVAHHDQYLKCMSEIGVPSDTTVRLPDGATATLRDLIQFSLAHFDIEQELEFTAVAYSRWLPPTQEWTNRFGERHSLDELARALLVKPANKTACHGTHTLYALTNLVRANRVHRVLSPSTLQAIESRLKDVSRSLAQSQDTSGLWLGDWHGLPNQAPDNPPALQAVWVTGHHLEWMALAPEGLRPSRDVIQRAARALARLIESYDAGTISTTYTVFSHAGRALAMLEGVRPAEVLSKARKEGPEPAWSGHVGSRYLAAPSLIAHLSLPESSMGQTVESVADAVSRNYQAFRLIPDLSITFTLTYEHLGGDRNFIFDRAVIETSRKGEMRRLHLDGDLHNGLKMSRSYASDGSVATGLHPLDETSGDYFIRQAPDNNLFYYNYYIDYLHYPDATGSVPNLGGKSDSAEAWLPRKLTVAPGRYVLRADARAADGTPCVLLEWPGREALWFEPGTNYALRQRDVFHAETGRLERRTILHDLRDVGDVWLPTRIVVEEYDASREPSRLTARRTIEVNQLSTDPIPEQSFRIQAPEGVDVHDAVRGVFFTHYGTGTNPVVDSAELARKRLAAREGPPTWTWGAAALGLAGALVALWTWHARRSP